MTDRFHLQCSGDPSNKCNSTWENTHLLNWASVPGGEGVFPYTGRLRQKGDLFQAGVYIRAGISRAETVIAGFKRAFQNFSKHLASRYVKGVPFCMDHGRHMKGLKGVTFSVKNGI